jgi:hypothetical protein
VRRQFVSIDSSRADAYRGGMNSLQILTYSSAMIAVVGGVSLFDICRKAKEMSAIVVMRFKLSRSGVFELRASLSN